MSSPITIVFKQAVADCMSVRDERSVSHWLGVIGFVTIFASVLLFSGSMAAPVQAPTVSDSHFAVNAAAGGMAEVKLGKLAQEKASDLAVKAFGKRMVDGHTKAGEQLKETARSENIKLPDEMKVTDQAAYDQLAKLSWSEFDTAYMQMMVKDHQEDVAEFKKEASNGKNRGLREFAAQTLPTLEGHLKHARDVASNRKASL